MCLRKNLNQTDLDKLEKLVADKSLNINATLKVSPALLTLCQFNRSESLYSALQILLTRDDLDINAVSYNGFNALLFICRFYSADNLLDCAQLLIDRGIDTSKREFKGSSALNILWDRNLKLESKQLALICKSRRNHPISYSPEVNKKFLKFIPLTRNYLFNNLFSASSERGGIIGSLFAF